MLNDAEKSISRETRALIKLQSLELIQPRLSQNIKIQIAHNHPPKMHRFKPPQRRSNLVDPGGNEPSPVLRDEIEHSGSRLPFELDRPQIRKPPAETIGGRGVAECHGHVLPRLGVDPEPPPAHEGGGVSVFGIGYVRHDLLDDVIDGYGAQSALLDIRILHRHRD